VQLPARADAPSPAAAAASSGIASAKMQRIVLEQTQRSEEDFKPVESLAHLPPGPWGPGPGAGEPESKSGPHSGSYLEEPRTAGAFGGRCYGDAQSPESRFACIKLTVLFVI